MGKHNPLWQAFRGVLSAYIIPFAKVPAHALEEVGIRMQSFLTPVFTSILAGNLFDSHWPAEGYWRTAN